MTVDSTPARAQYATNGTTGPWSVPFRFLEDDHLLVVYTDANGLQTVLGVDSGFTATGAGTQVGGTVTTATAYPAGGTITILLAIPLEQQSDYVNGDTLPEDTIERNFDALTMIAKQLQEQFGRVFMLPQSDPFSGALPTAPNRKNCYLFFDGNGQPVMLAAQTSATVASTTPTELGGVPELVDVWIQRERVFPEQFGATAGTGASFTAQLQKAMNAASSRGMPLNLRGRYYRADSGLVLPVAGIEIENGHLDLSHVAAAAYGITCGGALGLSVAITAPVARYATTLPLATTAGLAAGQAILVSSADFWASAAAVTKREWARIKSVDSGIQVTLTQPLRDAYSTTPVIYAPSIVDHVIMTNVHLHGGGNGLNQNGSMLQYVRDVRVFGSDARTFASRGMAYDTCQSIEIDGGRPGEGDDSTGLSYGHVISGATDSIKARAVTGDGLRHVISAGGTSGVVRGYRCDGIVGLAMTDSTVDAHPSVDDAKFYDIDHTADNYGGGANGDGLVSQARHTLIDGYKIIRAGRHAILVQPQCTTDKAVIEIGKGEIRDHASYAGSTGWAVNIDLSVAGSAGAARLVIDDVDAESTLALANGILVTTGAGAVDSGRMGGGRIKTPGRAMHLNTTAVAGKKITHLTVQGGYYERTNQTGEVLYWNSSQASDLDFLKFNNFHTQGGTYGLSNVGNFATNYHVTNFSARGYLTAPALNVTASGTTQFVSNANT